MKTDQYNYGSVQKELIWREGSSAKIVNAQDQVKTGGRHAYFQWLMGKIDMPAANFQPMPLEKIKEGECFEW